MTDSSVNAFDPYKEWLGLACDGQPDHYSLLGLQPFESDSNRIVEAADQQMIKIRQHQTGPRGAFTQGILNQIAEAKICLSKPASKSVYDRALKAKLEQVAQGNLLPPKFETETPVAAGNSPAVPPAPVLHQTPPSQVPPSRLPPPQLPPPVEQPPSTHESRPAPINIRPIQPRSSKSKWLWVMLLGVLIGGAACAVLLVWWLNG